MVFFYLFSLPFYVTFFSFFYNNGTRDSLNMYRFLSLWRALTEFFPASRIFSLFQLYADIHAHILFRSFVCSSRHRLSRKLSFIARFSSLNLFSTFVHSFFIDSTSNSLRTALYTANYCSLCFPYQFLSFSIRSPLFFFLFFLSLSLSRFTFSFIPFLISYVRSISSRYAIVRQRHPHEI